MHQLNTNHPSHINHVKYLTSPYVPGVIWFHVACKTSRNKLTKVLKASEILYQTSYGKTYDLIDMWPKVDETGAWLRLSVGTIGDPQLINKLNTLINTLCK